MERYLPWAVEVDGLGHVLSCLFSPDMCTQHSRLRYVFTLMYDTYLLYWCFGAVLSPLQALHAVQLTSLWHTIDAEHLQRLQTLWYSCMGSDDHLEFRLSFDTNYRLFSDPELGPCIPQWLVHGYQIRLQSTQVGPLREVASTKPHLQDI